MGWFDDYEKVKKQRDFGDYGDSQGSYPDEAIPHSKTGPDYSGFGQYNLGDGSGTQVTPGYEGASSGETMTKLATAGAMGAAAGGPVGAGIAVGGQLASQYFAEKAASERQRRAMAAQIAQTHAQQENAGYNTMMDAFKGRLK